MNCKEIVEELKSMASEKHKANVVRMGIPEESCVGVSTADIRNLAKKIGKSNELAYELWDSGYHEAKLLAVLLFDKKKLPLSDAAALMEDVGSWDLCDHLCKNLIMKIKGYDSLIADWSISPETYKKRAAFTLMAASAVSDRAVSSATLDGYLRLIWENSKDGAGACLESRLLGAAGNWKARFRLQ